MFFDHELYVYNVSLYYGMLKFDLSFFTSISLQRRFRQETVSMKN